MDAATDYEVLGTFYRVVEGRETCGSMVEKQSTASGVLQCFRFRQRRGRSMQGRSYFPCRGAARGCNGVHDSQQLESGSIWIDPR
jgi:hypothetical protein